VRSMRKGFLPALVVAALLVPGAAGQLLIAEDNAGDVEFRSQAAAQTLPGGLYSEVDLRSLTVKEELGEFIFTVKMESLKLGQDGAGREGVVVSVLFLHESRQFRLQGIYNFPGLSNWASASLSYRDAPDGAWNTLWWREEAVSMDPTEATITLRVPRNDLADASGASPYPGRQLTSFQVFSSNLLGGNSFSIGLGLRATWPTRISDAMPDNGLAPTVFPVQLGLRQEGSVRLASNEPFRASNGEATTFIYTVKAVNIGAVADLYHLRATKVPAGWTVTLPVPKVEVPSNGEVEFPVLASLPFSHEHGKAESFVLEALGTADPSSLGRIELGVRFLAVPQPAGHHGTLFLHSNRYGELADVFGVLYTGNHGAAFMNTLESFDGDDGIPLSPQQSWTQMEGGDTMGAYSWCVTLNPGLEMGLDFNLNMSGQLRIPLRTTVPMMEPKLSARLVVVQEADDSPWRCFWNDERDIEVAIVNKTQAPDIGAGADALLEGELIPLPAGDKVPYRKGQNLLLQITVTSRTPNAFFVGATTPRLLPGGQLDLPLFDYHDDVKAVVTTLASAGITALGPQERRANPGATIVFPLSIANEGDAARTLALNVTGGNAAWATVKPQVVVPAHSTARVEVVVVVPANARDGETADLILQATDAADESGRGIVRLLVVVDSTTPHPDDAALAPRLDEVKDTPMPGLALVALVVACLATLRRGKQDP
jgi:hypothetical protein